MSEGRVAAPLTGDADPNPVADPSPVARRLFIASVVAAIVPVLVAAGRAIGRGWIPVGDDAFFKVRAADVFTRHLPLLGTWSSGSVTAHINLNHPGPLLFDALAPTVAIFGGPVGIPIGVAILNTLAIIGIAVFTARRGGPMLGTVAMAAATLLGWAMGSELLYEPWQPHALLVPFLLLLVLVWSMSCGDLLAVPFAVGVGSFILETHLSYVLLVPALLASGVVGLALFVRGARRRDPATWPALRGRVVRSWSFAGAVLVLAWLQPVVEQFTSGGEGNLTRLVRTATDSHLQTVGTHTATLLVASVATLPPFWFRPSVEQTFYIGNGWSPPGIGLAVFSLVVLVGVLALCGWDGWRRRDRVVGAAILTSAVALPVGFLTAARSPVTIFGVYTPHQWRFLWPLATFVFLAVAIAVVRRAVAARPGAGLVITGAALLVVVVFAALNLPTANLADGPNSQEYAIPVAKALNAQLGRAEHHGPLLIDDLFRSFADPYSVTVLAELQRRHVDFVASDPALIRQLGPGRQFPDHHADAALFLRLGSDAGAAPPGAVRIAAASGLSSTDQRALRSLTAQVAAYIRAHGVPLNARGEAALKRGLLPRLAALRSDPARDPTAILSSRELVAVVMLHELGVDPPWAARFARYAALQRQSDRETATVYLAPVLAPRR